ncbi:hypothetical protein G7Z17_g9459 [Cylindrodendrum hubeiense]|uniref:Uncharacterized protein n=1 Tax=Cylindrodendrum hubeiense TaxID=595255 RepID=A0A9P5H1G4_9HYPO|nr:hypothetical protein G7Z17_g9459 [Cylindrodendrum hubeiense]
MCNAPRDGGLNCFDPAGGKADVTSWIRHDTAQHDTSQQNSGNRSSGGRARNRFDEGGGAPSVNLHPSSPKTSRWGPPQHCQQPAAAGYTTDYIPPPHVCDSALGIAQYAATRLDKEVILL